MKNSPTAGTSYDTTYAYDGSDNLASVKNGTASIYRLFDIEHRMTKEYSAMPASTPTSNLSIGYAYDSAGRVTEITYQDGTTKAYDTYDSLSRPVAVGLGASNLKQAEIVYDGAARVDYVHYFEDGTDIGLYEDYAYDIRDRVTEIRVYKAATDYVKLDYVYNPASDITHIDDNAGSGVKAHDYTYDGNGQLLRAVGPWGASEASVTLTYAYDAVGNLLSKTDAGVTTTYTYIAGNWNELNKTVAGSTTRFFDYNAAGSAVKSTLSSGVVTTYTYDFAQRLVKVVDSAGTHTYDYDGSGRRLKTTEPGAITRYFTYAGGETLGYKEGTTNAFFVYLGSRLILRKTGTADNRYYFQDLSSNVRMIAWYSTDVNVDFKARYKPFGEIVVIADTSPSPIVFKFAAQQLDASGLYKMGARYYDPTLGRFLSRDPVGSGYAYAGNNPLSFSDPTGAVVYRHPSYESDWWSPPGSLIGGIARDLAPVFQPLTDAVNGLLHDVWNSLPPSWRIVGTAIADRWNALDPNVRGAIVLTAGVAAVPLAGTALGSILMSAAVGAAIGAVTDAVVYTGLTLATGGQWSFEGMANAAAFGALVGGVTAGAGKAFGLWRAAGRATRAATMAADGGEALEEAGIARNAARGARGEEYVANELRDAGYDVTVTRHRLRIDTPFGPRYPDLDIARAGQRLGFVEVKTGGSQYTWSQRAKDLWIEWRYGWGTSVVRLP